ncbi:MAG: recombinase family protein [Ktedonobacterales bacterium]|nr:recombinase family protein [Ktedonobacterales bacterium]
MPRQKSHNNQPATQWELPPGSHVWVYLRHSPGDNQTIDSQASGMRDWCQENLWIIDRTFIDEAIEGSREDRPQFQQMMALSRQQPRSSDGIVIWSFSRFARDQLDSQFYKSDLRKRGFVVLSRTDEIPNNEVAPLIEAFLDWKNQRFLDDLSTDVKRGLTYLLEQGFWSAGYPPVGYQIEKVSLGLRRNGHPRLANKLIKDDAMEERVSLAWSMKLHQNASYSSIHEATQLFQRRQAYTQFFSNLLYAGIVEREGKRYPLDWQSGARFCEPYVTLEDFERVQQNRRNRVISVVAPRILSSTYLLTGKLICGVCADGGIHSTVVGGIDRHRYQYYRCCAKASVRHFICALPNIAAWKLEGPILQFIKDVVLTPDYLQAEIDRINSSLRDSQKDSDSQLRQAEVVVKDKKHRLETLVQLISRKGMTVILEQQYDELNKAWQEATLHFERLQVQSKQAYTVPSLQIDVERDLPLIIQALESGPIQERKAFLGYFVDHVMVYPDRAEVYFTFRLDALQIGLKDSESTQYLHSYGTENYGRQTQ